MKRKQFLATTLAAFSLPGLANTGRAATKPFVTRAGAARYGQPMLYKGKHPNNIVVSKNDTNGALAIFSCTGYEKIGPSLHLHTSQDEIFYVAAGSYRFVVGEETMLLVAGDTIFLPRNVPHTWIQQSDKGQLIYAVQPAGTLEDFFIEMNELKGPPTEAQVRQIHEKHGMKLVGPPLG